MNLNQIVYTSSDYKLGVIMGSVAVPVSTLDTVTYSAKKESEYTHVVGSDEPVGLKTNTSTYDGTLVMQAGELEVILGLNGFVFATQVINATISIIALNGSLVKIFKGVVFDSHEGGTKAKDKDSKVTLNWKAISAVGI